MNDADLSTLRDRCTKLAGALPGGFSWDDRFGMVLLTYDAPAEDDILSDVGRVLTETWTSANIRSAPGDAREVADALGGLRPGLRIMTPTGDDAVLLFGVFWPWGGGQKTSLRIGCAAESEDADAVVQCPREAFGV